MMQPFISALAFLALVQPPTVAPIVTYRFAQGLDGWIGVGDVAKATVVSSPRAALQFEYAVDVRSLNMLALPLEAGKLAGAQKISFSIKPDTTTSMVVILQEQDGGRFSALLNVTKDTWQNATFSVADFVLGRDDGDPKDANGKLDLDKVNGVAFADVAQFFIRSAENPAIKAFFPSVTAGPRSFQLADVSVLGGAPLPYSLDGLARPQIGWIAVGDVAIKRVGSDCPLGVSALSVDFESGPGKLAGLMRMLPPSVLSGKTELSFMTALAKSTSLLFQLEDDRGGKFAITLDAPGGRAPKKLTVRLSELKPTDDSKQPTLDPSRIKQLFIADISGITENTQQKNTLWFAGMEIK